MEQITSQVSVLSDEELRSKLRSLGENVGPLLASTRRLFEKRLTKLLAKESGLSVEENNQEPDKKGASIDAASCVSSSATTDKRDAGSCSHGNGQDSSDAVVYFGISVPEAEGTDLDKKKNVFTDKREALKVMKQFTGARFKVFRTQKEAVAFAMLDPNQISSPIKTKTGSSNQVGGDTVGIVSESSPFKGLKPQELVQLRKAIETGNLDKVMSLVWSNPRYVITSGDTPVILQEGFRYHALHVAAWKNQPEICQWLIDTLEDPKLVEMLYPQDTAETRARRIDFIVDLYLNMPDKGNCESPLHFACKFGYPKVVEILMNHPKTEKSLKNRYGETPKQVICSRARDTSAELKKQIADLLEGHYYIPLLRAEDNSTQPVIGQTWSPDIPADKFSASSSLIDPVLSVKAYVGPMSPSQAQRFREYWTTPPQCSPEQRHEWKEMKCGDSDKGLERLGRRFAHEMGLAWAEYWDFLGCFTDLSTSEGLQHLEGYLAKRDESGAIVCKEELCTGLNDLEDLLERLHLGEASDEQSATSENEPVDNIAKNLGLLLLAESKTVENQAEKTCNSVKNTKNIEKRNNNSVADSINSPATEALPLTASGKEDVYAGRVGSQSCKKKKKNSMHATAELSAQSSPEQTTENPIRTDGLSGFLDENMFPNSSRGNLEWRSQSDNWSSDESDPGSPPVFSPSPLQIHEDERGSKTSTPLPATPPNKPRTVFMAGLQPTKLDMDVLRALNGVPIDEAQWPHIAGWRQAVLSYTLESRSSWPSPARRRISHSAPSFRSATPRPVSRLLQAQSASHTSYVHASPQLT